MEERWLQFRVGMFVVLAMIVLGLLIFLNSEGWTSQYTLLVKARSAPNVTQNTPIRRNGILIGRVGSVETDDDHVALTLRINSGHSVYENEICSIGTESFLGDAVVEIIPVGADRRGEKLASGEAIKLVSVRRNPMEIVDVALNLENDIADTLVAIKMAGFAIQDAGDGVRDLTGRVQQVLGQDDGEFRQLLTNFRETSEKAKTALDNFNRIFEGINEVVGDEEIKTRIRETVKKLPEIFDELRITVQDTRATINSFRDISGTAKTNLDNFSEFTASLRENGPEILEQINASVGKIDEVIGGVREFSQSLSRFQTGDGTLGKLLNDPDLYRNVNDAAANIRALSVQLKPLVNDLRMFADSIARDPGQLGVRGAMDNRAQGTGYKGNVSGRERARRE